MMYKLFFSSNLHINTFKLSVHILLLCVCQMNHFAHETMMLPDYLFLIPLQLVTIDIIRISVHQIDNNKYQANSFFLKGLFVNKVSIIFNNVSVMMTNIHLFLFICVCV